MSFGLCGVILAAGQSSRMRRDKALLPWPKTTDLSTPSHSTLLSCAIRSLSDSCDLVIVVAGANLEEVRPVVDASGETLIQNPEPERGQFSSLQVGLQEVLAHGRDNAVVTLVDRPPVQPETLKALLNSFLSRSHGIWAVVPEFQGKHGHPILIGREMIEAFLRAPSSSNARDVEHSHANRIAYYATADPLVTTNLDTPEAYASLEPLP
jgi:molybdenum cofactor cytidylyltransferase